MFEMTNVFLRFEDTLDPSQPRYKAPLEITLVNGYVPQSMSLGFPEVRDVSEKRPNAHGTYDNTEFLGAGSVSVVIAVAPEFTPGLTDRNLVDRLKDWMDPKRRTWIFYKFDESEDWRKIRVRTSAANRPYNFTRNDFGMVSLSWRAIDGYAKGTTLIDQFISPGGASELGVTTDWDLTSDLIFPDSDPIGVSPIANVGNLDVLPLIRIYGQTDQPRVENRTTGLKMEFLSTYSILAGEYIDIDFEAGTVALNGDLGNSRYDQIDFSVSDWFPLIPGDNEFRFYPGSFLAPSQVEVIFLPNFIP